MLEKQQKQIKDLGWVNGWDSKGPDEYQKHKEAMKRGEIHEMEGKNIGNCLNRTTCHTCGISWAIDSSD